MGQRQLALLLCCSGLLAGCATAPDSQAPPIRDNVNYAQGKQVDRICFTRSIDGFADATRDSVVVYRRADQRYLLRTAGPCLDLDNAWSLSLVSFGSCLTPGDKIRIQRFPPGVPESAINGNRCTIRSIHEWARVDNADSPAADTPP